MSFLNHPGKEVVAILEEVAQSVGAQQALVSSAHPKALPCQVPPQALNSLALLLHSCKGRAGQAQGQPAAPWHTLWAPSPCLPVPFPPPLEPASHWDPSGLGRS